MFKKLMRGGNNETGVQTLPKHIAIIMDGNGRWAKKRGLPRKAGHVAGANTFSNIATYCNEIGIKYLTVYAFSTENWKRPTDEVHAIIDLLKEYIFKGFDRLSRDKIKINFLGDTTVMGDEINGLITKLTSMHKDDYELVCNIAFNYGGRAEIVHAVNSCLSEGKTAPITEDDISSHLYTSGQPEPDLLIRPGGEFRISNFLMWQTAYAEFYFTDVLWPDFSKKEIDKAIAEFQRRNRRFGGL
ncbi:MAG: polyprenyl diphosphate synthase [Bacillota bacterium]|nr:polyprenyl diphosphate synthase [Bacillota bacterium]